MNTWKGKILHNRLRFLLQSFFCESLNFENSLRMHWKVSFWRLQNLFNNITIFSARLKSWNRILTYLCCDKIVSTENVFYEQILLPSCLKPPDKFSKEILRLKMNRHLFYLFENLYLKRESFIHLCSFMEIVSQLSS